MVGKRFARQGATQEAAILDLTPDAIAALQSLIAETADAAVVGIRIAACGAGCAGLSYQMGLETEVRDGDSLIRCGDVTVVVDQASKPLLQGTCVDFCDSPAAIGFVFDNPNACGSCGSRKTCSA